MSGVSPSQRFTRGRPCVVCGGYDNAPRGQGVRCAGFLSDDGNWAYCTREGQAGGLDLLLTTCPPSFRHRLDAPCRCGINHGTAAAKVIDFSSHTRTRREPYHRLGTWDCTYIYVDEQGEAIHRTVRFRNPKSFRHQHWTGERWQWGLGDTRTVLYHLPDLLLADPRIPIFVPEGEKDVERLCSCGLIATTNPIRGKWESWYNRWIEGRHVVILEDRDAVDPRFGYRPGEFYANRLAGDVRGAALSVQIVSFPNMPEGSDISDWLDAGGSIDRLLERIGTSHRLEVAV